MQTHLRKVYRDRQIEFSDAVDQAAGAFQRMEPQAEVMKEALDHCVRKVHGRSRQALLLRYTGGLELKQIAERLGMTAGNVGVLLHRVRTSLRECVQRRLRLEGHS